MVKVFEAHWTQVYSIIMTWFSYQLTLVLDVGGIAFANFATSAICPISARWGFLKAKSSFSTSVDLLQTERRKVMAAIASHNTSL